VGSNPSEMELVRVSGGEFELSEFELPGILLYNFIDLDCFSMQAGTKF